MSSTAQIHRRIAGCWIRTGATKRCENLLTVTMVSMWRNWREEKSKKKSGAVAMVRYDILRRQTTAFKVSQAQRQPTLQQMGWNLHRFTLSPPALTVASDYGLSDSSPEELNSLYLRFFFFFWLGLWCLSRNILFWMCVDWFHNYGNKGDFQTLNCHNWFLHHAPSDRAWVRKWGWIL